MEVLQYNVDKNLKPEKFAFHQKFTWHLLRTIVSREKKQHFPLTHVCWSNKELVFQTD